MLATNEMCETAKPPAAPKKETLKYPTGRFHAFSSTDVALDTQTGQLCRTWNWVVTKPSKDEYGLERNTLPGDESPTCLSIYEQYPTTRDFEPTRSCARAIVRLATWEGMRPSEILALTVEDVDGDSVWVKRRLYKGDVDDPKTQRSVRQVALTLGTKLMLTEWMRVIPWTERGWLFPSENGSPVRRDNLWRRYLLPRLEPAGLDWATFQVMRRSFATLSKEAGIDAHTRSAQMGNTVDVNENEYAVASFEQKLAAVRRLETADIQ